MSERTKSTTELLELSRKQLSENLLGGALAISVRATAYCMDSGLNEEAKIFADRTQEITKKLESDGVDPLKLARRLLGR